MHDEAPPDTTATDSLADAVRKGDHLRLLGFGAIFFFAVNFLLVNSEGFWLGVRAYARSVAAQPLTLEGFLRVLPRGSVDVAVLGNSVVNFGVEPNILASRLQLPPQVVKTMVLPGATDLELAMLLPELERIAPKQLIYITTVGAVYRPLDWDNLRLYDPRVAVDMFDAGHWLREHTFHASGLLAWSNVVVRHRERIREALEAPLRNFDVVRRVEFQQQRRRELRFLRGQATRDLNDFACPTYHTQAVGVIARRMRDIGANVIVVAAPLNNEWDGNPDLQALLDECLGRELAGTGATYIPRAEATEFPEGAFLDGYHLNQDGRAHFTADLARYVLLHGWRSS